MKNNLVLCSDSYKYSHPYLYPENVKRTHFYIEPRGGKYDSIVFFGLQYYLKEYLSKPITQEDINEAEELLKLHGVPFFKEGWQHILEAHNGYLPLRIRAVPEGTVVPNHNVLMTIENTDDKCFWLPGFIETLLLKVWYPTTVASRSLFIRKMILDGLNQTADDPMSEIDFKLHSFGYRGVSSEETAGIGGLAETLSFKGSDTLKGILFARDYYDCSMSSFSIPAYEHSVICSWGKDNEVDCYRQGLKAFGQPNKLLACVSDTYDLWNCIEQIWTKELKQEIINSGATIIIRLDSGIPHEIVLKSIQMLDDGFGHTINSKGFKVLNYVKVIQGDGIDDESIPLILKTVIDAGYSITNLALGCGGGMLQKLDRDTCKFAMKLSAYHDDNSWVGTCKDPVTDPGKKSKMGRLDLVEINGTYQTITLNNNEDAHPNSILNTVFENGKLTNTTTLDDCRKLVIK